MDKADTFSVVEKQQRFDHYIVPEIPLLLRVARSLTDQPADAEDLAQETLLRAYRGITDFDGYFPRAWLLRILHNTHISRIRRRTPLLMFASAERDDDLRDLDPHGSPENVVVDDAFDDAVEQALGALRQPNRKVVDLVDIEGLSYAEAALALDVPIGTVVSRLHRARKQIREHLADHGVRPRGHER
ncbi:RNA polymerase sigma factor [Saccharopolyspora sp. ID03-671]|uniref:RNA polymerase sigma factor n=1 Tax=Saccharopolyspora sp. ID03-671 TaxID=3073066 RepID=UPI0032456C86